MLPRSFGVPQDDRRGCARLVFALLGSFLLLAAAVRASADPGALGGTTSTADPFDGGSWSLQAYGGYLNDLGAEDTEAAFGSLALGYFFLDHVSLNAEFTLYGIGQPGDDAAAGSVGLTLRQHFPTGERSSFFLELGGSLFEATENVPENGTRFNYVFTTGVGVTLPLADEGPQLMLGVRYLHLSNANREGDDRNPSINGIVGYVGLVLSF